MFISWYRVLEKYKDKQNPGSKKVSLFKSSLPKEKTIFHEVLIRKAEGKKGVVLDDDFDG